MPWKQNDRWWCWVRDAAGVNRKVSLAEAKNREQAKRLEADLRMKARRQAEGLEPLATDRKWTVRQLLRWWLDEYVKGRPSQRQEEGRFRLYFEGQDDLVQLPVVALTSAQLEVFLQHWAKKGLAPASVNKLRAMVRTAWNRARKAGKVVGPNPATDVEPRKVPKRAPAFLEADEVPRLLAQLSPRDRPIAAVAIYAGLRKGELFGLHKGDVDLPRRLLIVRRSYDRETTKGGREEAVPIAAGLVPYLEEALANAGGDQLFPKLNGSMRTDGDALGERMRRGLGRAGIVTGYLHTCRRCKRRGKPYAAEHPDNERRRCPQCSMVLWAKPIPKKLRLHDTRHTTATLLLAAGADMYAVARILRHTDPRITFETYAHLVPGYLQEQVDRLSNVVPPVAGTSFPSFLSFSKGGFFLHPSSPDQPSSDATPVPRKFAKAASAGSPHHESGPASGDVQWRAWQESNLRPAASKAAALSS
jgi:integrase